ncbi:MAG: iron-containing alcohol dehydrogenase [Spirochaetota bacterium]
MSEVIQFNFPTIIRYGSGAMQEIATVLQQHGFQRPLLVTDTEIAKLDILQQTLQAIAKARVDCAVFSELSGNPLVSHVESGKMAYLEHKADCIIAFGGGAAMDVAKCIAIVATHLGSILEYEDKPGMKEVDSSKLPVIFAIPTTAGTGSEVGRSAVVSDTETKVKKIFFAPGLLPKQVFLDPMMTLALPEKVTSYTGIDALTHCLEAYLAKGFHPMCDGIALEGIALVAKSLEKCVSFVQQGVGATQEHLQARAQMLLASSMGAIAFQKGLGVNHSCAHALSAVADLHHGLANAIVLPVCMEFNRQSVPERFMAMARAAELGDRSPEGFMQWLQDLRQKLKIPDKLSQVGVAERQLPRLVDIAFADVCHSLNPRTVSKQDFQQLFQQALH